MAFVIIYRMFITNLGSAVQTLHISEIFIPIVKKHRSGIHYSNRKLSILSDENYCALQIEQNSCHFAEKRWLITENIVHNNSSDMIRKLLQTVNRYQNNSSYDIGVLISKGVMAISKSEIYLEKIRTSVS